MASSDITYRDLAAMWEARDPMPEGLVERVLVAIGTEDLDAEYELLHLMERSTELAGARGAGEAFTISFAGGSFSLLLRVSAIGDKLCRVDGWVTPAKPMTLSVSQKSKTWEAVVDAFGRFELPKLPTGLSRFWLASSEETTDGPGLFATPTFEL
ncbi:MAG: hypothetical protein ACRDO2_10275 [Nocardioidaceae bacterium]